ncbi:MAG: 1-acyl-sn-glycerol-3-phosphate acyltransferase [Myxococcaceae bacterium]|nr:1-acyl-sn-glycerol-3-phosphate acyltransferase [Myxococcaceae bacterium]
MRKWFCIFIAGFATLVFFPCTVIAMALTLRTSASMYVVQRWWSPVLLWAGGATLEVIGKENADPKRAAIYVCNHQSTLDIPAVFRGLWPVDFRFVVKQQLKYVPVLGWYLSLAGYPFVDRGNHAKAVASLAKAGRKIRNGTSVVVFAEGTRSDNGSILPFKKGPFALAMEAKVPVIPVTIEGTRHVMPKNSWDIVPGPVRIKVGQPIDIAQFDGNRDALIRAVRDVIIAQSLELGGLGGDSNAAVAARGKEGIGRAADEKQSA